MPTLDTVVMFAAANPSDVHHESAMAYLSNESSRVALSGAALLEFDIVLKSRGFSPTQRRLELLSFEEEFPALAKAVGGIDFPTLYVASLLEEAHALDYFDALVAADALTHDGKVVSTDRNFGRVQGLERLPLKP